MVGLSRVMSPFELVHLLDIDVQGTKTPQDVCHEMYVMSGETHKETRHRKRMRSETERMRSDLERNKKNFSRQEKRLPKPNIYAFSY